jgi:hypothetical protein
MVFERDEKNGFIVQPLLRWNDDACRLESMTIVSSKDEK